MSSKVSYTIKNLIRRIYNVRPWGPYPGIRWTDVSSVRSFYDMCQMYRLMYKVRHYTMLDMTQLILIYRLIREVNLNHVPGDVVQCGVWNGGSGALMAFAVMQSDLRREIWLFDSFQGMPRPTEKDGHSPQGWWTNPYFVGDPEKVRDILQKLYIPNDRVHIVKGWFQDTIPSTPISQISLLHIDADWYESVKLCLEYFYDRVSSGGFMVFDDYGLFGCKEAVDEFIAKRHLKVKLIWPAKVGCYFRKED